MLDQLDLFNLMVIPPDQPGQSLVATVWQQRAAAYCQSRQAFLLVAPPATWTSAQAAPA